MAKKKLLRLIGVVALFAAVFVGALFLAVEIENNEAAQQLVERFGYAGIIFVSFIAGFNLIVPVSASVFAPIFTAAGYPLWGIVAAMSVGTILADTLGYAIGVYGRTFTEEHYPKTYAKLKFLHERHHRLVLPFVFLFVALAPLPNEVVVIPLAVLGFKLRTLAIPFILGTVIHHSLIAYGVTNIFEFLF